MSTSEYIVLKPIRDAGRTIAAGSRVALTARQAKWLLFSGKIARIGAVADAKAKTAKSKPASKKEE